MDAEERIEQYSTVLASGDRSRLQPLLRELSGQVVYAPVTVSTNVGDSQGTKRIRLATLHENDHRIIPVFTVEDYFFEWSDGSHQCLPVNAADLALTLPPETFIRLNAGKQFEAELTPEDVAALADADLEGPSVITAEERSDVSEPVADGSEFFVSEISPGETAVPPSGAESAPPSAEPDEPRGADDAGTKGFREMLREDPAAEFRSFAEARGGDASGADRTTGRTEQPEPRVWSDVERGPNSAAAQYQLMRLLDEFPEVIEGYYKEKPFSGCLLGLLTQGLDVRRRFDLVQRIADLSRRYFGEAGGIEVFDDLCRTTSKSWELFQGVAPFYTQGKRLEARERLADELFARRSEQSPAQDLHVEETAAPAEKKGWQALLSRTPKILSALRLGGRE